MFSGIHGNAGHGEKFSPCLGRIMIMIMFCELGLFVRPSQGKKVLFLIFVNKVNDDATFHFILGLHSWNSPLLWNSYWKTIWKIYRVLWDTRQRESWWEIPPLPWSDYDHVSLWIGFLRPTKSREDRYLISATKSNDDATFHFTLGLHSRYSPQLWNSFTLGLHSRIKNEIKNSFCFQG